MDKEFNSFINEITLTTAQSEDAKVKYTGVCEKLYKYYYEGSYDDRKKYLFGSYKLKTNIRPLTEDQDVDVLFKIPKDTYDRYAAYVSNGQSALLQEVKNVLKEKYSTTDTIKAWGKVVLVQFSDGHHNVELLPAFEQEDETFIIPNSENGGSWDIFDPRSEVKSFLDSNDTTKGLTRNIAKMAKKWVRNTTSLKYKSYLLLRDIISFLGQNYPLGKGKTKYSKILLDYFDFLKHKYWNEDNYSYFSTAYERANSAISYADDDKPREASEKWRLIFGKEFPYVKDNPKEKEEARSIVNPARPWCI